MKEIKAYGEIRDGGFYPRNPEFYYQQVKDAGNVSDCVMTIEGSNSKTPNQHRYMFAVCSQMAFRMQQDGWDVDSYDIYKKIEEMYCKRKVVNENTGKVVEYTKPLKKQTTDRYSEIIDAVRHNFMQQYSDTYIQTPAEWYGMSEENYDLWKNGVYTFKEAKDKS